MRSTALDFESTPVPTQWTQANLMPELAAELWPFLEVVAGKYGLQLGSPSAAGCGAQ